jgi:hypothetical protein
MLYGYSSGKTTSLLRREAFMMMLPLRLFFTFIQMAMPEHAHDWGEVFGFIGTGGRCNTGDMGGEIEFWLGGEKYLIAKSSLVWVPPGLKHCPIQFNRIDHPCILFTLGMTRKYSLMSNKE